MFKIIILFFLTSFSFFVNAETIERFSFESKQKQERYNKLITDIRCPVCQGQSIGGSNAPLAKDLRLVVRKMLKNNKTDNDIFIFMTERYGNFVVFKPPVNKQTYILWFAPFIFIIFAIFAFLKKKSVQNKELVDEAKLAQAKKLLK